jgi:hypothetical protein
MTVHSLTSCTTVKFSSPAAATAAAAAAAAATATALYGVWKQLVGELLNCFCQRLGSSCVPDGWESLAMRRGKLRQKSNAERKQDRVQTSVQIGCATSLNVSQSRTRAFFLLLKFFKLRRDVTYRAPNVSYCHMLSKRDNSNYTVLILRADNFTQLQAYWSVKKFHQDVGSVGAALRKSNC